MIKRIATAAGLVLALQVAPAQADPYYGYDGRNYGEFKSAPDFGRPKTAEKEVAEKQVKRGTGQRKGLTSAALALLERIETQFGPVHVISGYRAGARIAGTGRVSRHASGNAIDFDAGGRKSAIVKWLIANHKSGGTMTYANMGHIHVDIGPHFVSLNSGGGGGSYSRRRTTSSRYYGDERYSDRSRGGSTRYSSYERRASRYADRGDYGSRGGQRNYSGGYATLY